MHEDCNGPDRNRYDADGIGKEDLRAAMDDAAVLDGNVDMAKLMLTALFPGKTGITYAMLASIMTHDARRVALAYRSATTLDCECVLNAAAD